MKHFPKLQKYGIIKKQKREQISNKVEKENKSFSTINAFAEVEAAQLMLAQIIQEIFILRVVDMDGVTNLF